MTAPTVETVDTLPDGPIPDDLLAAALEASGDRAARFVTDDDPPKAVPTSVPAPADAPKEAPPPVETPAEEAETPSEAVDPLAALLKDAKPLDYKANGASRTADFILSLGERGAFIAPDKVNEVRRVLSSADANAAANRALFERVQSYEQAIGPDLGAYHTKQEQYAGMNAVGGLLFEYLTSADKLLSLIAIEGNNVVPNRETMALLKERAAVLMDRATIEARQSRAASEGALASARQDSSIREGAIPNAIDHVFADADEATRAEAKEHFTPFASALLFKATAEDVTKYAAEGIRVTPGEWMVDVSKMAPWFAKRAENRAAATKAETARVRAEKENAARAPVPKPTPPKAKVATPRNEDGTFAEGKRQRVDPSDLYERAMRGQPVSGAAEYDL